MADLAPFLQLTPSGLLGLVFLMVVLGYLIPVRIVRGRLADKDATIAAQAKLITILSRNNAQLLKGNTATVQVLDALPDVVGGDTDAEVV